MTRTPAAFVLAAIAFAPLAGSAAERDIQRWVDDKGVVHYGDAPPPEAAKNGRAVLNEYGVVVHQIPRQLTADEAAAARLEQEQASRRKAQDSFLLTTYTRVADIERARDDQLALIDAQIELARTSVTNAEVRLQSLQQRMSKFRPYAAAMTARRVPDHLAAEVVRALSERRSAVETLARHEQRRVEMEAKFSADISRYQELTSRPSIR